MLNALKLLKKLILFAILLIIAYVIFNKYCGINPSTFDLFTIILLFGSLYIINDIYL
jgi:hypothetical protein